MDVSFFQRHPLELLVALVGNPSLPRNILKMVLVELPSVTNAKENGSDQLQKLLAEQASQHGTVDLLLSMNEEVDDLLECLEADISENEGDIAPDADVAAINEVIVDSRHLSSYAFFRSSAFASLVGSDISAADLTTKSSQKVLTALQGSITVDLFCLQQTLILLTDSNAKPLSVWLVELVADDKALSHHLWRMQDHTLLTKVASRYATFFLKYLGFLISSLQDIEALDQTLSLASPAWYSSATRSINNGEDLKIRLRSLASHPRLTAPTKKSAASHGLLHLLE